MTTGLLIGEYAILAAIVVYAAKTLGDCVDEIDARTDISGALLGGILLAAITSLPEFMTSIISTVVVGKPGLAFGNIFGSNLFNLSILAVVDVFYFRKKMFTKIKGIQKTNMLVLIAYIVVLMPFIAGMLISTNTLNYLGVRVPIELMNFFTSFEIFSISYVSFAILFIYYLNLRALGKKDSLVEEYKKTLEEPQKKSAEKDSKYSKFTMKKLIIYIIVFAIVLIIASLYITKVTDRLSIALNLNASVAGALFLGIATSLPELTSCFTLAKLNNFEAASGGIIGSNIFNLIIISVVDIFSSENVVNIILNDLSVRNNVFILLILGLINTIIYILSLMRGKKFRSSFVYLTPSLLVIINYAFYLLVSLV